MSNAGRLTMRSFYSLSSPGSRREYGGVIVGKSIRDIALYSKGLEAPTSPIQIKWGDGNSLPADTIWVTPLHLVVSPRFIAALSDFTGWTTYPVEVFDRLGELVPGYAGLVISGNSDRIVPDLTRVEDDGQFAVYVGQVFELDKWDGSDLFYPRLGIGPIVTERVRKALAGANITNLRATRLTHERYEKFMIDRMIADRSGPYAENEIL